jgi:hypothetical protein
VGNQTRDQALRFLQGLSADELQYIAEFLGSCILESDSRPPCTRGQLAEGITEFERRRRAAPPQDVDHKMILLLEYLCCCGLTQFSLSARAGQA